MAETFQIRAIKPGRLNVAGFERAIEKGLDKGAKIIERAWMITMGTWRRKAPVIIATEKGRRIIWVDSDIMSYLNYGTRIRWALMSRDWRSKTKPRRLKPGPGRGFVVIAGRRAMQRRGIGPRPGIKARRFDKTIVREFAKPVQRAMNREIEGAAKNAF